MGDVATARPLTQSQQLRKVRKPLIERKRRERINGCLNELKSLVLESLNKDEAQFSKLEKADILELALEVLKKKTTGNQTGSADPSVIASKYTAGFSQCALEVTRCLGSIEGVKPEVRLHLTEHLASCVQKIAKSNTSVAGKAQEDTQEQPTRVSNPAFEAQSVQYSGSLTPPASPDSSVLTVTSPLPAMYSAQPVQIVGHVVTSSPTHLVTSSPTHLVTSSPTQLVTSSPPYSSQINVLQSFTQQLNVPVAQQQQQQQHELSNDKVYGHVVATSVSHPELRQGHCVLKPQPVSALYQAIPSGQNVWRPW